MRIAFLSMHSSPLGRVGGKDTGGMSIYLRELARVLGRRETAVDIYTRTGAKSKVSIVEPYAGVRIINLPAGPENAGKERLHHYTGDFAAALERFARDNGLFYDLLFSHYWLSGAAGLKLQGRWKVPHFIKYHTLGAVKSAAAPGEQVTRLRIKTEKKLARNCTKIIVPTVREMKEVMNRYGAPGHKVTVIPCGVNMDLFKPEDQVKAQEDINFSASKLILFVGRLEPVKGLDLLIRAFAELPGKDNCRLLIIGGDEASAGAVKGYQELARQLGIVDRVHFAGLVAHEELPAYYNAARILVIPSYYESFGLTALEALACGTPVVSTDVGDLRNIIIPGQTGWVLEQRSPVHFAYSINNFLEKNYGGLAGLCRKSVAPYSWGSVAERLIKEWERSGTVVCRQTKE